MGGAELHGLLTLGLNWIDRPDLLRSGELCALNRVGANATDADDSNDIAGADLARVHS